MLRRSLGLVAVLSLAAACARTTPTIASHTPSLAYAPAATPPVPVVPAPVVVRTYTSPGATGSGVLLADLDGRRVAYVADEDAQIIRVIDLANERELSRFAALGAPGQLAMLKDGRLVATLRDGGKVVILRGGGTLSSPLVVDASADVAAEPIGLAITPDEESILVTSGWGHTVTVLDAHTFTRKATFPVGREPRSVVISDDGKRAFVAHAVGQVMDVIPLDGETKAKTLKMNGDEEVGGFRSSFSAQDRAACQGFALAKTMDGRVLAPHVLVFSGEPVASEGYGGGGEGREPEVFHVPVIDEDNATVLGQSRTLRTNLESATTRCALPRAAVVGKAGLYVTCLGDNQVRLFDAEGLNPQDVALRDWAVPAGPTAIALDEENGRAVVWSQFAHALTMIALDADKPFALSSLSFETNEDTKLAKGRRLFHAVADDRISGDGRACASCHPDGRDDSLVWSSPKGPRQTPMLAGRLEGAAPFGWNGDAADVSTHLASTMKRLGGKGMDGDDKEALVAYIRAMKAPPSLEVASDAVTHGRELFQSDATGCASCHGSGGDLPDGTNHDVKSARLGVDTATKFDTPSLRFIGGSAPYFHDGRYPDLKTLLVKSDGKMGHTKQLSPTDLNDLTAYLETL